MSSIEILAKILVRPIILRKVRSLIASILKIISGGVAKHSDGFGYNFLMLTKVLLMAQERRRSRLFFGEPLRLIQAKSGPDPNEMHALFRPHAIFGLEVWEANEYGTISWRFYILKTVAPGEKLNRIPEVIPGAQILLRVSGKEKVAKVKAWLRGLAHDGTDPSHIPAEYFLSSHSKLWVGLEPRNLTKPHGKVLSFLKRRGK